jgi:hypothetical protein
MNKTLKLAGLLLMASPLFMTTVNAQKIKDGKLWLNEDGSNYFKVTLISQVWFRHTEMNPGTVINGYSKTRYDDIGIRRARLQAYGQITDRVFIYTQVGLNNFNFLSNRKEGFFIHDVTGEYEVVRKHLSLGAGLTAWNGLTRFAAPSVGSILGLDAPLFEQNTNDVTDQFLRKLSAYAKGKIGKLDYRLVVSNPMSITKSADYNPNISSTSAFSPRPPKLQWHGYFQWQFLDQEANTTAYNTGTYLGTKRVFNIGAGFQYQPDAMWHLRSGNAVYTAMKNFAVDAYYDAPLSKSGAAISAYAAFMHTDYGPGYIRNQATMNPGTGTTDATVLNRWGNGYPAFGTGNLLYGQVGFKFKNDLIGKTTLLPYASLQYASYDRLKDKMFFWDAGVNWLLSGHTSKITVAYQDRPIYRFIPGTSDATTGERKGALIVQYQVFLN